MSFEPINKIVSKETFSDDSAKGFTLSSFQRIKDGKLVLIGTPIVTPNPDLNWEQATWSQTSFFRPIPNRTSPADDWGYETTVPTHIANQASDIFPFTNPKQSIVKNVTKEVRIPFGGGNAAIRRRRLAKIIAVEKGKKEPKPDRYGVLGKTILGKSPDRIKGDSRLVIETGTSNYEYIYQNTSDTPSSYWPDNVDNVVGWTIELKAYIPSGTSELILDDGAHHIELELGPHGIYESSELKLHVAWKSDFRKVRIASFGDNLFMLNERGSAFVGTSYLSPPRYDSTGKDLRLGNTKTTVESLLYLDYFHQSHLGVYLDIEDDIAYVSDTGAHTTYTPELQHTRKVDSFIGVTVKIDSLTGGTVKVQTQYQNTSNPSWTNHGSLTQITDYIQELDLSGLSVDGDGSDKLRFQLIQQAADTSSKPPAVEELTVITSFGDPEIQIRPNYGPSLGGNTVRIISADAGISFAATDSVYIGGVLVASADVTHVSTSEKYVIVPAGPVGPASVRVEDISLNSYLTDTPYRYLESYDRGVDRAAQIARVCGTKSAIRIKNEVPYGEVNLAYISTPGIEAQTQVGTIDLSYIESGNIVGGSEQPLFLDSADTSELAGSFSYSSPPNTRDIVVAAGSAGWRDLGVSAPLFYYHLIGKGKYYIKKEQSSLNLKELRDSIFIHYTDGTPVSIEDYPWDIVVTNYDIHGNALPEYTYMVMILTTKKFIPGKTVMLTTTVADPAREMGLIQGYSEIINPKNIFSELPEGNMTYSVEIDKDGEFTLTVRSE